jgi:uncharacterized coiled-coil DUF342 family protein
MLGTEISENEWERKTMERRQFLLELKEKLSGLKEKLKGLGVSPQDYVQESQEVEFSMEELNKIQTEMETFKKRIDELESTVHQLNRKFVPG